MFSKFTTLHPFKSQIISTTLNQVNELLANPSGFNRDDSKYLSEELLQKTTKTDDETHVFIWLSRIKRYLIVSPAVKNINSKNKTASLILDFLKNIDTLAEKTKKFLCSDSTALNCLTLTLLMSEDRNDWELVLELIHSHSEDNNQVYLLLKWYYDSIFNLSIIPCDELITSLRQSQPGDAPLQLSASPISHIFQFVILSQNYIQDPQSNFTSLRSLALPFNEENTNLEILATIILQGTMAVQFTQNTLVHNYLETLNQIFRVQFQVFEEGHLKNDQPRLKTPSFKLFLEHFIHTSLQEVNQLDQKEQLIGLSQIIRFHNTKTFGFPQKIYKNGIILVQKLFALGKYTEAYYLHDDLIQFVAPSNSEPHSARIALYCFCCRMEQWLSGLTTSPTFNQFEKPYINQFKKSKLDFKMGEKPATQLFNLATKIAQHFSQSPIQASRNECKTYYGFIKQYLSAKQKKEIERLFTIIQTPPPELPIDVPLQPEKEKKEHSTETKTLSPIKIEEIPTSTTASVNDGNEKVTLVRATNIPSPNQLESVEPPKDMVISKLVATSFAPQSHPPKDIRTRSKKKKRKNLTEAKTLNPITIEEMPTSTTTLAETESFAPLKEEVISPITAPSLALQSPLIASSSIEQEQKVSLLSQPSVLEKKLHSCTFFTEKTSKLDIRREQLPQELLTLIDELREQFPQGSFYLTGAAPGNLLNRIQPHDYDILAINIPLYKIQMLLQSKKIYSEQRSRKFPIVYCELSEQIRVDFSAQFLEQDQNIQEFLEIDYLKRDFNLNAFYCQFTDDEQFQLFSFSTALENRNTIDSVSSSPVNSFHEDPTRLFRLAKLLINYPNIPLAERLKKTLDELENHWFYLFNVYLQKDPANLSRLDLAIRKLFLRYNFEQINNAFAQLKVLTLFSGNTETLGAKICAKIPPSMPKELNYQAWIIANCLSYREQSKLLYCPLVWYMIQTPIESRNFYIMNQLLAGQAPNRTIKKQAYLLDLFSEFHLIEGSSQLNLSM